MIGEVKSISHASPGPDQLTREGHRLLLQRKCACGNSGGSHAECEECRKKRSKGTLAFGQAKLAISQPGDAFEQEADHAADQVMRMADPVRNHGGALPSISRIHSTQHKHEDHDDFLQQKESFIVAKSNDISLPGAPPIVQNVLSSPGEPLDAETRAFMEPRFGHDFSRVRVHSDAPAANSAKAVNALAYTVGRDIVFGTHQYAPQTTDGRRLLAHELTHTVQQGPESTRAGRLQIFRQPGGKGNSGPEPVAADYKVFETPLEGNRFQIRVRGTVGDPISRPGLEKKFPLPKDVGLPGYDRWHLAGPDATGAEEGILYAPKNFNVSKTADIENIIRKARAAAREQGGDVYFDFTAEGRVVGEHEGVQIRVLEKVTWKVDVRAAGSDKTIPVVNETASPEVPGTVTPPGEGMTKPPGGSAEPPSGIGEPPAPKDLPGEVGKPGTSKTGTPPKDVTTEPFKLGGTEVPILDIAMVLDQLSQLYLQRLQREGMERYKEDLIDLKLPINKRIEALRPKISALRSADWKAPIYANIRTRATFVIKSKTTSFGVMDLDPDSKDNLLMYESTEPPHVGVSTRDFSVTRRGQSLDRVYLHYTYSIDLKVPPTPSFEEWPETVHRVRTDLLEKWPTSRVKMGGAPLVPQNGGPNVSLPKEAELLVLEYTKGPPPFVRVRVINTGVVGFIQPIFIESL